MCGIIGYIGKREAIPLLLEGLSRMEYRGYDSAGVAIVSSNSSDCIRAKGKVGVLMEKCSEKIVPGQTGIGHTRWATHGEPSEKNAHPHTDCSKDFFVAHNGIIENHQSLKDRMIKKGHRFSSDTDTEVIAHLIEEHAKKAKASNGRSPDASREAFREAVVATLKELRGAFGVVVISKRDPGTLIAARFASPLVLGIGKNEYVVASDTTAILPITNSVIYLEDGELVSITKDSHEIIDFKSPSTKLGTGPSKGLGVNGSNGQKRRATKIGWDMGTAEKEGFPHFMLKEIFEQPEALKNTMRGRLVLKEGTVKLGGLEALESKLRSIKHLTIGAMGTARITGMVGEYLFEKLANIPTKVEFSSEFAYRALATDGKTGLITVSQSGETADTLNAIKEAKRRGMPTIGIVNVIGSSIAREVDAGIYNHVGPEIAVASTKASTSQVMLLTMLALYLGRMRGLSLAEGQSMIRKIQAIPKQVESILKGAKQIEKIAKKYKQVEHMFFLGRKYNAASAMEGALKLKEVSYVHAEGYNAAELKHGPIALIDKNFVSLVIAPKDSMYEKNKTHIEEIKARGGKVIAITTEGNKELEKIADDVIYIPKTMEMLSPILMFVPMQLFAYYMAVARGNDVDKPRNLAKSVTVE